jgi:hypothetical protein
MDLMPATGLGDLHETVSELTMHLPIELGLVHSPIGNVCMTTRHVSKNLLITAHW